MPALIMLDGPHLRHPQVATTTISPTMSCAQAVATVACTQVDRFTVWTFWKMSHGQKLCLLLCKSAVAKLAKPVFSEWSLPSYLRLLRCIISEAPAILAVSRDMDGKSNNLIKTLVDAGHASDVCDQC
jgi:hypothetical protein